MILTVCDKYAIILIVIVLQKLVKPVTWRLLREPFYIDGLKSKNVEKSVQKVSARTLFFL